MENEILINIIDKIHLGFLIKIQTFAKPGGAYEQRRGATRNGPRVP